MVWIGCLRCEKFRRHFVAQPSALIAPVLHDLHRVSYNNKIVAKETKHYETHQNMRSIQWYGSGAFIANNFDATSLHDLLH